MQFMIMVKKKKVVLRLIVIELGFQGCLVGGTWQVIKWVRENDGEKQLLRHSHLLF